MRSAAPGSVGARPAVHIGRQPIYDRDGRLHAYELLFRHAAGAVGSHRATGAPVSDWDDDAATTATILAAFSAFDVTGLLSDKPGFVNLTRTFLVGDLPIPFGPEAAVLEVLETVEVDDEVVRGVRALVDAGYVIALDDFVQRPRTDELLEVASIVKVDVLGTPWPQVLQICRTASDYSCRLLAERVEDAEMMRQCVDAGFELFQGYHLGHPETLSATTLTPGQAMLLRVLAMLSDADTTAADLEPVLRVDPALTYRLLKIANSASGGSRRHIRSLRDAVVMVGLAKLRSWVVLLSLGGSSRVAPGLTDALVQAHCCEIVAHRLPRVRADEAFTLGLLDGVGHALGLPPADLPALMPVLAPELAAALGGAVSPLRSVLDAVHGYVDGDLTAVQRSGCMLEDLSEAYLEALTLASRVQAEVAS